MSVPTDVLSYSYPMTRHRREGRKELETDPRFPSGRWVGFWLQRPLGRQHMSLEMIFEQGHVTGAGVDCIGDFVLAGSYHLGDGRVSILKHYVRAHTVEYDGKNEDDGRWIWGLWTIRNFDRGGFHLWPDGAQDPTKRHLRRQEPKPGRVRRRGVELEPVRAT